ncbi:head-tail connector protein [Listeria cornellensis]|uniref:Phage related protein n=1 Tax=Listeria cornellensis FSL F6-0969 TaxID=1265820 RepID=W7C1Y4_9LIST|nr:head-tail connector protein [Listeria cornellensis]EUJ29611.1 Phage related protein [Listeria cornellensis FSL F6-0969]
MALDPNSEEDFEYLKSSLRIDSEDDDLLLKRLVGASQRTLIGQIGPDDNIFYDENEQFDLATIMLTDHFYKTRSATIENVTSIVPPFGVNMIILDLKASYRVHTRKVSDLSAD